MFPPSQKGLAFFVAYTPSALVFAEFGIALGPRETPLNSKGLRTLCKSKNISHGESGLSDV